MSALFSGDYTHSCTLVAAILIKLLVQITLPWRWHGGGGLCRSTPIPVSVFLVNYCGSHFDHHSLFVESSLYHLKILML
jgi:hypothetical protein